MSHIGSHMLVAGTSILYVNVINSKAPALPSLTSTVSTTHLRYVQVQLECHWIPIERSYTIALSTLWSGDIMQPGFLLICVFFSPGVLPNPSNSHNPSSSPYFFPLSHEAAVLWHVKSCVSIAWPIPGAATQKIKMSCFSGFLLQMKLPIVYPALCLLGCTEGCRGIIDQESLHKPNSHRKTC